MASKSTQLTGQALEEFLARNPNMSKRQMARETGYVSYSKQEDGSERENVNIPAFLEACAALSRPVTFTNARGRRSSKYQTSVHGSGVLLVGYNYVQEVGVGPGDTFDIVPNPETGDILLRLASRVEGSPLPLVKPTPRPKKQEAGGEAPSGSKSKDKAMAGAAA